MDVWKDPRKNARYHLDKDLLMDVPRLIVPRLIYATMYRNRRYKLVTYHGSDFGELYDLENDPDEQYNLWEAPGASDVRCRLIKKSFDESIVITDPGSRRIGRF